MSEEKDITIYDIAKALNLSGATISRALNNHKAISSTTKQRIIEKAKELGYRSNPFASNLRKKETNTIGVIIPRMNSNFVSTVLAAVEKIANEFGYNVIISQSIESVNKEILNAQTMFDYRVDGLLVSLAYNTTNIEHFKKFAKKGTPIIFFDRIYESPDVASIVIDNFKNGYDLTQHLIEQGCKHIMHVTGNLKRNVYRDRFEGYKKALKTAGLEFNDEQLIVGELNEVAGIEAAEKILEKKVLPDAIFFSNDLCAASCMLILKQNGIKIPQDIAIVGFNNDPISRLSEPNITTVNYPASHMGEMAATQLINHLKGVSNIFDTKKIILQSEILIRESSLKQPNQSNDAR
ncbi:MAG: LacI family DNA-binding transcriptional regulator [Saprospiraceae bacterium]|nr:LacI family DNA-binding transcriptional regulator [Saprospiraceae bacterium]